MNKCTPELINKFTEGWEMKQAEKWRRSLEPLIFQSHCNYSLICCWPLWNAAAARFWSAPLSNQVEGPIRRGCVLQSDVTVEAPLHTCCSAGDTQLPPWFPGGNEKLQFIACEKKGIPVQRFPSVPSALKTLFIIVSSDFLTRVKVI